MKQQNKKARWRKRDNPEKYARKEEFDFIDCTTLSKSEEVKLRSKIAICPKCDNSYDVYADFIDHYAKKWYLFKLPGCPFCVGLVSKYSNEVTCNFS